MRRDPRTIRSGRRRRPTKAPVRNALDASYAKFDALAGDISSDDDINDYYEDEYHAQMDAARRAEFEDTLRNPDGTWKELPPLVRQPGKYIGDMPPPSYPPPDVAEAELMADMDRLAERTEAFTRNGAAERRDRVVREGRRPESEDKGDPAESQQRAGYMWSQEHDECVLSVVVPRVPRLRTSSSSAPGSREGRSSPTTRYTATTLVDDDIAHRIDPNPGTTRSWSDRWTGWTCRACTASGRCATGSRSRWEGGAWFA